MLKALCGASLSGAPDRLRNLANLLIARFLTRTARAGVAQPRSAPDGERLVRQLVTESLLRRLCPAAPAACLIAGVAAPPLAQLIPT